MKMKYMCILFLFVNILACKKKSEETKEIERSTVTDIEGNVYQTVKIGDQWWMAENLKVKKYNDGSSVNEVLDMEHDSIWRKKLDGAFYFNNISSCILYNGFVVKDARKIAPEGWHIPSDEEWKTLEKTIGMSSSDAQKTAWRGTDEGNKLTSKYSAGWPSTSILLGTDEYGFNAVPGGNRVYDGYKNTKGSMSFWWSSTSKGADIWYRYLDYQKTSIFRHYVDVHYGFTIRCVKD
jgi:uncharacterized protein (TIGR02145 family)